jgi:hypothetical protein
LHELINFVNEKILLPHSLTKLLLKKLRLFLLFLALLQKKQEQGATMSDKATYEQTKKPQTRREKRDAAEAFLKNVSDQSFPNSKKIYIPGKIHDIKVGMREITLTDTLVSGSKDNPV